VPQSPASRDAETARLDFDSSRMPPLETYFLIGPMGSGKNRPWAGHLGEEFSASRFSTAMPISEGQDRRVDISFIFEKEGEAGFRIREREAIDRLTAWIHRLATGGGAVIDPDNRPLSPNAAVVSIYRPPSTKHRTYAATGTRPC